jgi:hypothetical protein
MQSEHKKVKKWNLVIEIISNLCYKNICNNISNLQAFDCVKQISKTKKDHLNPIYVKRNRHSFSR